MAQEQRNSLEFPVYKRKIGISILLSIVTLGIYLIYWEYLIVKNTKAIKNDDSSCTAEMLCLVFVPFYSIFWWFTRGKTVKDGFAKRGYDAIGNEFAYLILGIYGMGIVSMAIMQNDFNSLPYESIQSNDSLDELITEETTKRLDEMASPDYEFPEKINRWDVVWMVVGAVASAILIALCMTGVIS